MTDASSITANRPHSIARPVRAFATAAHASEQAFFGFSALLFIVSAAVTVACCNSMSAMGTVPMPGGWMMTMTWMRMPGQTWAGATASFVAMWLVMMLAMMLPTLVPMLSRYRRAIDWAGDTRRGRLTAIVGSGYFSVWTLLGLAIFPIGAMAASIAMKQSALARSVPIATGFIVLVCGALQCTRWKAHHLACCREAPRRACTLPADSRTAWQQGLGFGLHCSYSCLNLTVVLLVFGMMDLRAMALVTAAITTERLAPDGKRAARFVGAVLIGAGLLLTFRAMGL